MRTYACVYIGSAVMALLATPLAIRLAWRIGLVDTCSARRVHLSPTPRIGGVVIVLAMLAAALPVLALDNVIGQAFRTVWVPITALLGLSLVMAVVGLVDDVRGLGARVKLAAQTIVAVAVCSFGIRIDTITLGHSFVLNLGWLAWPITIFWIVGICNAVNLIDGLDGLAAGISMATCGVIAVLSFYANEPVMGVLMLALLGSLTGFLRFNFHPARVFMGDCGSLFLGFILAVSSIQCSMKSATLVALALPLVTLGLPIFDILFSMVRRALENRSIFAPDRGHIHHRMLQLGLRQRHAVIIMYLVTLASAGVGMFMMVMGDVGILVVLGAILVGQVAVFQITGTFRLGESIARLRKRLDVAGRASREKRCCERAEVQLGQASTVEIWWQGLCEAAAEMQFAGLWLTVADSDGTSEMLSWQAPGGPSGPGGGTIHMDRTIGRDGAWPLFHVKADMPISQSLESAGRKVALLGRLIDRCDFDRLPSLPLAA